MMVLFGLGMAQTQIKCDCEADGNCYYDDLEYGAGVGAVSRDRSVRKRI
jgi:hypothetical protein